MRLQTLFLLAACAGALQHASATGEGQSKLLREIPIGGEGGWDILTIDSPAHRLYLSRATKVVVLDLEKNAVTGEITARPQCTALSPSRNSYAVFRPTAKRPKRASLI